MRPSVIVPGSMLAIDHGHGTLIVITLCVDLQRSGYDETAERQPRRTAELSAFNGLIQAHDYGESDGHGPGWVHPSGEQA